MQKNFCYNIRIKDENWRIMRFFIKHADKDQQAGSIKFF
ncbi:hypothetical protein KIS1582_4251 [Cytobacillus firmus]|uniref:Uncharacterized protein n=1 Tax=Cytobacillus firmus TaxID=1399 RepID=A0A800N8P4_CYTFI|nr:hypothetical protein KIS1582_4251 [Cytobacillus firmus]